MKVQLWAAIPLLCNSVYFLPTKFLYSSPCPFVIKPISENKNKGVADLLA